jgi:hypothetical protein
MVVSVSGALCSYFWCQGSGYDRSSMCSVDFVLFDFVFSWLHNAIVVIQFFVRDTTTVQGSYQASDPVYPAPCPSINTTAAIPPSRRHLRRPSSILP